MSIYEAARLEAEQRWSDGWRPKRVLGRENTKLKKGEGQGWKTFGLSLAPAKISGYETCASRSPECTEYCLFTAGRGLMKSVMMGRIFRTLWYYRSRPEFVDKLMGEIDRNRGAAIRLNVISDIQWERQFPEIFTSFPDTQFYDYTKHTKRMFRAKPANYHLTFSLNERNEAHARSVLDAGLNISMITDRKEGQFYGYDVIDGDEHDLWFLDPVNTVAALSPKGVLKNKHEGIVRSVEQQSEQEWPAAA